MRINIATLYGDNYGETTGIVKFNSLTIPVYSWSDDSIKVRIPNDTPRGYYTYKIYNTSGTLVDSTYHGVRIIVPRIYGGE